MKRSARLCIAALALLSVGGCAAPDGRLHVMRDASEPPPLRRPLTAPGSGGALPPPSAMFEKAQSRNASERAEGRAELKAARARAGLDDGLEKISFLDLPDGVAFAMVRRAAVAAPQIAGLPDEAAASVRAGFLDALGGAVPRERAYLADKRFLAIGEARAQAGGGARLSMRVFEASGAAAGTLSVAGAAGAAKSWLALGRRAAEKFLALPQVAAAISSGPGRGFAAPGAVRNGDLSTASVAENAVAVVSIEGARGGGPALTAALREALKARGLQPSNAAYAPHRISARVTIRSVGAKDRAEIVWLFTEQGPQVGGEFAETVIGEAKQARTGRRGAFDGAWGAMAVEAANAAADAFVQVIAKPAKAR